MYVSKIPYYLNYTQTFIQIGLLAAGIFFGLSQNLIAYNRASIVIGTQNMFSPNLVFLSLVISYKNFCNHEY